MKKILYYLPSIIFNFVELLIIYIAGLCLRISTIQIVLIFMSFVLIRTILGGQLHYKDWYKCSIWSILVFMSFFLLAKVNITISLILVIFSGMILTTKGNIKIEGN